MTRHILSTLVLLGLETIASGQSVVLSIGSGSGTAGGTVTVPITVASTGGAQTTGLQWTFNYSSDIAGVTVVAGASATNAGKSLSCSGNNCLVAGINSTVIADGAVASATFQIAANPSSNPIAIQLTSVVATTAGGASIPSSGGSGTIILPVAIGLSSLNCTSSTINTPGSTSCSVALTGAAAGSGLVVSLASNNANLTVPSSVTVASGQTSNTFTATGAQVGTNQTGVVTASAGVVNLMSTLNLVAPAQLTSVSCAPSTLGSSASSTCTVNLNKSATSAATVSLASNNGLLTVPAGVTVATGQSSATFTAAAGTVNSSQNAIVTATLSGQSRQATISLAAAAQLSALSCSPSAVNAPGSANCTVTLNAAASNAVSVTLSSNNANVTVPPTVNISAGLSSAMFTATVAAVTSNQGALLTASLNGVSQSFTLTATAPASVQLSSLSCAPSTLASNASSACTVTLTATATSAATVSLASNNGLLTVPAGVTVATGQSTATFTAASGIVSSSQNAIVTATLNGQSQQTTISLAAAAQLNTLTCSPSTVITPGTATCTATMTATASSAASVALASNNTNVTVPASINIGSGLSSATFTATVAAVTSDQSALLTASLNGVSQSFTLSATAPASIQLSALSCAPSTLGSNASSTCTVTLNAATTTAAIVSLASNNGLLTVPASVTIATGQSTATFTAASGTVSSSQNAIVTATLNGQNQQATISLAAAAQLSALTCSPSTVIAPATATCTATLTAAASSAASVTLLSNNASVTVPAGVNIGAGLNSATFTATVAAVTSDQGALLTASLNGGSQTFTLSAQRTTSTHPTSLFCSPSAVTSNVSVKCTVSLDTAVTTDSGVSIASNNLLFSAPSSVNIPAGQSSATFTATSGSVSSSQNAIVTATLNGQSQQATITLAPAVNCQEFQTSPGGLCMIRDVFPWISFGGGWESRLNAGNLSNGAGSGTIQFSFTLLPAVPATGGSQNHMPAYFKDSITGQTHVAETATYALNAGGSVAVDFLSPAAGCDSHGQNCGSPDPNTSAYGSLLLQYVADNPASLRGIAKAQLALLANVANPDFGWQTTESETPAANQWTAPVSVSANPGANPQATQQASAALSNPGPAAIIVRGTLYDRNGISVTFRDFQVPSLGAIALVFSQDPSQPFGGFGQAMFPLGQDFNGLVTFQVISPSGGSVSAMVLQYVGNAVSIVEMNPQSPSASNSSETRCAEFAMAVDGSCSVQYTLPWVAFGGGWESRLKAGNPPSSSGGAVQFRFTLVPAVSAANGVQNHLPAFFTDNRTGQLQVGDSANYTLSAGQSVDVHFLYPPAGCDSNGQNCANQPDPNTLSYGSVIVQYSSFDPGTLRRQAKPQLAFLARPNGEAYSSQITEKSTVAAKTWTAPVTMSADPNANPQTYRQASAAIQNPGSTPVTVRGTLRDQDGNVVTSNDFVVSALGATGIVFGWDPGQPFGGFGMAAFPQGRDFSGWVTFDVTSPGSSGVSVLVLQYAGNTISGVNAQSLP